MVTMEGPRRHVATPRGPIVWTAGPRSLHLSQEVYRMKKTNEEMKR
jgi:hypothetical protein